MLKVCVTTAVAFINKAFKIEGAMFRSICTTDTPFFFWSSVLSIAVFALAAITSAFEAILNKKPMYVWSQPLAFVFRYISLIQNPGIS